MKKLLLATLPFVVLLGLSSCDTNRTETTETTDMDRTTTVREIPGDMPEDDTMGGALPADTSATGGVDANTFMTEAADGGMAEVAHGKLAASKATNAEVKKFGQMMTSDHSKANEELKAIAAKKNVTLPGTMSQPHQEMQDRLSKLSGAEFDRQYMSHMVADHEKTVNLFRSASQEAQDPDIKAFAAKHLPTIEQHLQQARDISSRVGANR